VQTRRNLPSIRIVFLFALGFALSAFHPSVASAVDKTVFRDMNTFFKMQPHMSPSIAASETTIQHSVYFDDLEGSTAGWGFQDFRTGQVNAWHTVSGTHACTGNSWWCGQTGFTNGDGYGNNWIQQLQTNVPIDLTGTTGNKLTFNYRMQCEFGYDVGWVLIHDNNAFSAWDTLAEYSGNFGSSCSSASINIADSWAGRPQPIKLMFLFGSDISVSTADSAGVFTGWSLDNVKVTASGNNTRFTDDMESGTSKWVWSSPDPGNPWHIESGPQTTPPAGCFFLNTNVFVPFSGSGFGSMPDFVDAMVYTPPIDLNNAHFTQNNSGMTLKFDQWSDLPQAAGIGWSLMISGSNDLSTWTPWRNAYGTSVMFSEIPACGQASKSVDPYYTPNTGIQPGTRYIRLGFRAQDLKATDLDGGSVRRLGQNTEGLYVDDVGLYYAYTITGVEAVSGVPAAAGASLQKIYPNPFNPSTTIEFSVPVTGSASMRIYDIQGKTVATLFKDSMAAGVYRVRWNGQADNGRELSSGVYFARLETAKGRASARLMMIK